MKTTVCIDIETAGSSPWRNPITRFSAAHFEGDEPMRLLSLGVIPRDNSEVLWNSRNPIDTTDAKDEISAMGELSAFCWASGREVSIVLADTEVSYPFLVSAWKRRPAVMQLPGRVICLKTFACLLSAHGRFSPRTLELSDLYNQITGEKLDWPSGIQRALAIGTVYNEFSRLAGWSE